MLRITIAALAVGLGCSQSTPTEPNATVSATPTAQPAATARAPAVDLASVELRILGMTWADNWPRRVRATLATVPGVQNVDVEFERDLATVTYESARGDAAIAEMITALEGLGYKSWTVASETKKTR